MKQILKRMSSVFTALLCAMAVAAAGAAVVSAESEIDESLKEYIITSSKGLTEEIVELSGEEIAEYTESGTDFAKQAMGAWASVKDELGKFDSAGAGTVELSDGQYTVTIPAKFEKLDSDFVYVFDETGAPISMSVDVKYPMSVTLERAGLNTLMGLATVFLMLVFLSFVIYLFKYIPALTEGKKKNAADAPAAPAPAPVSAPSAAAEEPEDDTELIAVIAAAIAASEGTGTDGFVVRSIRKINRKKW